MAHADADKPFVMLQIINPIGNGLAQFLLWKVVSLDTNGVLHATQDSAGILQISEDVLFLCVDRDRWF